MSRKRAAATQTRTTPDHIPSTTMKLGWGDRRAKTNTQGCGFYVYCGRRFIYQSFDTYATAKHFLLKMIAGREYTWETWSPAKGITPVPMIRTDLDVTIRGPGLEDVMEYEFADAEEAGYVFPENYSWYDTWALRGTEETETTASDDEKPAPKAKREPRAPAEPKPSKEGLVTVATIAESLKADAKHVRAALRKAKVEKPQVGWAFPATEVARITQLIKDNLK